ncbi:MAG: ABC transporter ATP-binding protein [Faecalibacterium prausnitzii]
MSDPKFYCCAEDLAIGYGKTPLMEHIGLGVGKGTILTLIGPNGAGKSTLLKTLAAAAGPQGGAVLLDGKNLADYSGPERARKMALMVPHTRRTELTTCFEMASAGRYPYTGRLGVLSAEDKRQVHAALALVGAEALAGRDFNRISDGQRQRVLLARAICQQPELILLDEPTSFLDIKGKAELLAILKSLARGQEDGRHPEPPRAGAGAESFRQGRLRLGGGRLGRHDAGREPLPGKTSAKFML